ncbi:MAG: hypothetical protein QM212_08415 [Bacteroidota bacterium]|nr:hypothetical protein [Bacteroidota bacterium]
MILIFVSIPGQSAQGIIPQYVPAQSMVFFAEFSSIKSAFLLLHATRD